MLVHKKVKMSSSYNILFLLCMRGLKHQNQNYFIYPRGEILPIIPFWWSIKVNVLVMEEKMTKQNYKSASFLTVTEPLVPQDDPLSCYKASSSVLSPPSPKLKRKLSPIVFQLLCCHLVAMKCSKKNSFWMWLLLLLFQIPQNLPCSVTLQPGPEDTGKVTNAVYLPEFRICPMRIKFRGVKVIRERAMWLQLFDPAIQKHSWLHSAELVQTFSLTPVK